MIKMHRAAIRAFLDFREGTTTDAETVAEWLAAHILPHEAKQDSLIEAVYQRYRALKIEPPTSGRIERLVGSAQRRYSEQFCEQIVARLSAETKQQLDALLELDINEDGAIAFRSAFGQLTYIGYRDFILMFGKHLAIFNAKIFVKYKRNLTILNTNHPPTNAKNN